MNKLQQWFETAVNFINRLDSEAKSSLPTLTRDSPDDRLDAWIFYFDHHLGARPVSFDAMLSNPTKAFTLPAQWPEWVDKTYLPPATVPPQPKIPRRPHDAGAALPGYGPSSYTGLCERYRLAHIPRGWNATDVCQAAARYGAGAPLQTYLDSNLPRAPTRSAPFKTPTDEALRAHYKPAHAKKDREAVPQPPDSKNEPLAF